MNILINTPFSQNDLTSNALSKAQITSVIKIEF